MSKISQLALHPVEKKTGNEQTYESFNEDTIPF